MIATEPTPTKLYTFSAHKTGYTRHTNLWLIPDPTLIAYIDHVAHLPIPDQITYWAKRIQTRHPEEWANDAIRIGWWVASKDMSAPLIVPSARTFDHWFTTPIDDDGYAIDWRDLPVYSSRFQHILDALNYRIAPLQKTLPLRTLIEG